MKIRQDAWTEENDLLLAETVLRHVREGSTQLNAFDEVGDKLNRTAAACGFRWNAVVRHTYEKALQLARKQRKQRQRLLGKDQGGKKKILYQPPTPSLRDFETVTTAMEDELMDMDISTEQKDTETFEQTSLFPVLEEYKTPALTMDDVIVFLQSYDTNSLKLQALQSENERLRLEIRELKNTNKELQHKLDNVEENTVSIQEDYETLMNIMNRARKLALLDEDDRQATKFKMDRNGNLEKIAE
ncbi:RsfA family transcriptional regulator [Pradoshia sp. D12]|uniref:RsfA family transcriptional regulator n=1 Tax=Bacillaceae TaxID=186817 RepID=UPI0011268BD8|nr:MULTISPECIES: RsfA family transcriptional regulator [Bacillaceae]QFK73033.1 RsfA family transcriptional regulator [Pradoshia sp. D12]TPF72025.1 RsfA family transcriptional regulator [Bacillus sp. D12]